MVSKIAAVFGAAVVEVTPKDSPIRSRLRKQVLCEIREVAWDDKKLRKAYRRFLREIKQESFNGPNDSFK